MRAINSAVALSKHFQIKLKIIWVKDLKLNCRFTDIFIKPNNSLIEIVQPTVSFYTLPFTYRFPSYMRFIKFLFSLKFDTSLIINSNDENFNFKIIDANKRVFIAAFNEFYPAEFDSGLFTPTDEIKEKVEIVTRSFNEQTYGIHIRRTDNPISINSSPTELFESEIENIINQNKDALFFVASDSDLEKNRLLSKFGDRIITSFFETKRQSTGGMKNAVIDLYSLSKTKMIIGSYWSSFSDVAAAIGNIPLKIIRKQ